MEGTGNWKTGRQLQDHQSGRNSIQSSGLSMASRPLPQPRRLQTHCLKTKSTASSDPGLEQTNGAHKGFPGFSSHWGNLRSKALGRCLVLGRLPASKASILSSLPLVWAGVLYLFICLDAFLLPHLFVPSLSPFVSSPILFLFLTVFHLSVLFLCTVSLSESYFVNFHPFCVF